MTASESPSSRPSASQPQPISVEGQQTGKPQAKPAGSQQPSSPGSSPSSSSSPPAAKKRPPILLILLVLATVGGAYWYFTRPVVNDNALHVSGRIEGYETNVGPKVGGRVDFISSREGDEVKKGQPLVKISDDDIQAQLRGARARYLKSQEKAEEAEYQIKVIESQIDEAKLSLTQSGEDARAQIDQAEANVAQAEARLSESQAQLAQAKADWELAKLRKTRFDMLASKGAVSQDEDDQAVTTESTTRALVDSKGSSLQAAKKQLAVAKASLNQARSTRLNPAMKSARIVALQQQLMQSQYSLKSAKHDISDARAEEDQIVANIAYLNVLSPIDGIVTARAVEPGAVVVPGTTLLSLINLDTVYLRGYVPEGQIGRVKVGQKARVQLDTNKSQALEGTVIQIDPEGSFTPENIYFKDDRVKQVFGIKIGISRPDRLAKPGMPADAEILINEPAAPANFSNPSEPSDSSIKNPPKRNTDTGKLGMVHAASSIAQAR